MRPAVFYFSDGNDIDYLIASLRSVERNAALEEPPIVFSTKPIAIDQPHRLEILQELRLPPVGTTVYGPQKFMSVCMRIAAIDWLRERDFESAIYLDTDTIVMRRMALIERSLEGNKAIGAVEDLEHLSRAISGSSATDFRIPPSVNVDRYFNSGVLALQLNKLPSRPLSDELYDFLTEVPAPAYPDQDFLNWYAKKYDLFAPIPGECNAIAGLLAMTSTTFERDRNRRWFIDEVEVAHYASVKPDSPQHNSRLFYQLAIDYLPDCRIRRQAELGLSLLHPLVK
jgi:hypothetical protein